MVFDFFKRKPRGTDVNPQELKCRTAIKQYRDSVKKLKQEEWSLDVIGNMEGPFPVSARKKAVMMIEQLKLSSIDVSRQEKELAEIDRDFEEYKLTYPAEYEQFLYCLLDTYVMSAGNFDPEILLDYKDKFCSSVLARDRIETLSKELDGHFDIRAYQVRTRCNDEVYKDVITQSIKKRTYDPADDVLAPDELWWRHLEAIYGRHECEI